MIHRYNTIFRNYNYSKNTYKIETRDIAALAAIYGYLVALDLAYRKNITLYSGNPAMLFAYTVWQRQLPYCIYSGNEWHYA